MTEQTEEPTLPEKYCARCGFLYGVSNLSMLEPKDMRFDPDLLRSDASKVLGEFEFDERISSYKHLNKKGGIEGYTFGGLNSLNCLYNVFPALDINIYSGAEKENWEIKDKLTQIQVDRAKTDPPCPHFFPYRPGFSAKEHSEIQMQQKREAVLDGYLEREHFREMVFGVLSIVLAILSIILALK